MRVKIARVLFVPLKVDIYVRERMEFENCRVCLRAIMYIAFLESLAHRSMINRIMLIIEGIYTIYMRSAPAGASFDERERFEQISQSRSAELICIAVYGG